MLCSRYYKTIITLPALERGPHWPSDELNTSFVLYDQFKINHVLYLIESYWIGCPGCRRLVNKHLTVNGFVTAASLRRPPAREGETSAD